MDASLMHLARPISYTLSVGAERESCHPEKTLGCHRRGPLFRIGSPSRSGNRTAGLLLKFTNASVRAVFIANLLASCSQLRRIVNAGRR
jgi:hypothetical protein